MVFACQQDSYLQQPCDYGFINDARVENVRREGSKAIHFTDTLFNEGEKVSLKIDWDRRFDHMQQHSGQHLITAIASEEFGYETTAWWLGKDISHIEFDTPNIEQSKINRIEQLVNEHIRKATPVTVAVYGKDNPIPKEATTRGLPDDHEGDVRVITIEGIESNMCCGTHVTNLAQLQVIKLVKAEKGKKGKTNLEFLVGERVLKQISIMFQREQSLTNLLKNSPDTHAMLVEKLQNSTKISNKNLQTVLKDIAVFEAKTLKSLIPKPKYYCLHRREADMDFMNTFIKEVNDVDILLFVTVGEDKGVGQMILHGKPDIVSELGPQICDILDGKGFGGGPKFQAKVNNAGGRSKATKLIKSHFD